MQMLSQLVPKLFVMPLSCLPRFALPILSVQLNLWGSGKGRHLQFDCRPVKLQMGSVPKGKIIRF